ncbi:MAG: ATP-binding protein, partial [Bacteroidota bacterium]
MDHPTARELRRTLLLTQLILAALVLLTLVLAHAWDSLAAKLAVVTLLLSSYALLVVRPLGKSIEQAIGTALRRAEDLQHDVERLEEAHASAEANVQAKSAFLAAMSHEIRTPMNGVIGMASLLDESRLDGAQRDFVSTIRSSGDVLLTLINDVLDLSKIEAGEVKLDPQPVALRPLVEAAFDLVASRAAGKGLDLVYAPAPSIPEQIETDPTRLRQILVNLLANAVRHTAEGEVVVAVRPEQPGSDRLIFEVRDTGEGIPQGVLGQLFRPYQQAERQREGTGLGLHICKRLARLLGGSITAHSIVGVGSTFTVTIEAPAIADDVEEVNVLTSFAVGVTVPNRALREALVVRLRAWGLDATSYTALDDAEAALEDGYRCHVLLLDLTADEASAARVERLHTRHPALPVVGLASLQQPVIGLPLAARLTKPVKDAALHDTLHAILVPAHTTHAKRYARTATNGTGLRVLIVEDHATNQKVALRLLERLGVDADLAIHGREAVEAVQRTPYDLVLMDVQMPVMDGVAATHAIRALDLDVQPRIVALTAEAMDGDRDAFLEAGMDAYLAKPFSLDALAEILDEARLLPQDDADRAASPTDAADTVERPGRAEPIVEAPSHQAAAQFYRTLRARLAQLIDDDDPVFVHEMLTSFLAGGPLLLGEIYDALYRGDQDTARRAAQTLRSSAALLGAEALADACQQLEQVLLAGDVSTHRPGVNAVQDAYRALRTRLQAALAEESIAESIA